MIQNLVYSFGGALLLIILGTGLLNKLGIIPVVRFKSLAKAFLIISVILFIGFTFQKCSDSISARKVSKQVKSEQSILVGYWKNTTNNSCLKITKTSIDGLFDDYPKLNLKTVNYKISSPGVISILNPVSMEEEELTTARYKISSDKKTLTINNSMSANPSSYTKITEKEYNSLVSKSNKSTSTTS